MVLVTVYDALQQAVPYEDKHEDEQQYRHEYGQAVRRPPWRPRDDDYVFRLAHDERYAVDAQEVLARKVGGLPVDGADARDVDLAPGGDLVQRLLGG